MSVQLELDTQILASSASSIDILLESQTLSGSSSVELVLEPSVITVETDLSGGWAATTGLTGATGATGSTGATGATGFGVPASGTMGQYLKKNSNTSYDTFWGNLSLTDVTGALTYTPFNRAGDTVTGPITLATTDRSAAAWTTNGINLILSPTTFTDTTSTGTVTDIRINAFKAQTLAATNAITATYLYGTYFTDPIAGTNITATNRYAIGTESLRVTGSAVINGGLAVGASITFNTSTANLLLGSLQTTGVWTAGGPSQTGLLTLGQSTVSQTTNIQAGSTASGSTKTVNIGTGGLSGSTTNINIGSAVSGALGYISLQSPSVNIGQTPTNINYLTLLGNITTAAPQIQAVGTDTNINLVLVPKGTGATVARSDLIFRGTLSMQSTSIAGNPVIWSVQDQTGAVVTEYGRTDGVASAAIWDFHTGATSVDFDSRVNASGGTGTSGGGNLQFIASSIYLAGSSNGNSSLQVSTVTSAVNWVKVSGAIAGTSPIIEAQGTNADIDLALSGKGTGGVKTLNTFTAPYVRSIPKTVATLAPASIGAGVVAFITDSNVVASGNFGAIVVGGGSNGVPVYSDGTNWRIG